MAKVDCTGLTRSQAFYFNTLYLKDMKEMRINQIKEVTMTGIIIENKVRHGENVVLTVSFSNPYFNLLILPSVSLVHQRTLFVACFQHN